MKFVDTVMLGLGTPDALQKLVFPPGAAGVTRIRQLLTSVYGIPTAAIHDVVDVAVVDLQVQRPVFASRRWTGTWNQTLPAHARTEVNYEGTDRADSVWLDISARLAVTVVLESDGGAVESITLGDVGDFSTLAEFRARFDQFDADEFLAAEAITTVEQLKDSYQYLAGHVRLRAPPNFDPAAPANRRHFDLDIAVLVAETVELVGSLRTFRLATRAAEETMASRLDGQDAIEIKAPFASLLVLPAAGLDSAGGNDIGSTIEAFFRAHGVLAVFHD